MAEIRFGQTTHVIHAFCCQGRASSMREAGMFTSTDSIPTIFSTDLDETKTVSTFLLLSFIEKNSNLKVTILVTF